MSLDQLNAELSYLQVRLRTAGSSAVGKSFRKEIAALEGVRQKRFGVVAHRRKR
jgi:hypothetical protein